MFLLQENKDEELTPSMDIFSAGYNKIKRKYCLHTQYQFKIKNILIFVHSCVLAELFSDGHPPFDLSQLLSYRNNPKDEQNLKFLNEIEEPAIKVIFSYYDV